MTSECDEHQKKIAALILGDLTKEEVQTLEAHLAACSHCRSERESYERTIRDTIHIGDEDIPHHFFIYSREQSANPWQLFRGMPLRWQAAMAGTMAVFLLIGIAAISHFQIRFGNGGWAVSFGGNIIDTAALKSEILKSAAQEERESRSAWIREVRSEIERSQATLIKEQKVQLTSAFALLDSRTKGRISSSEGHVREETQQLVADLYRVVSHERARDMESINLRLDSTDARNAIKTRQQNEILGTLLQVADSRLR